MKIRNLEHPRERSFVGAATRLCPLRRIGGIDGFRIVDGGRSAFLVLPPEYDNYEIIGGRWLVYQDRILGRIATPLSPSNHPAIEMIADEARQSLGLLLKSDETHIRRALEALTRRRIGVIRLHDGMIDAVRIGAKAGGPVLVIPDEVDRGDNDAVAGWHEAIQIANSEFGPIAPAALVALGAQVGEPLAPLVVELGYYGAVMSAPKTFPSPVRRSFVGDGDGLCGAGRIIAPSRLYNGSIHNQNIPPSAVIRHVGFWVDIKLPWDGPTMIVSRRAGCGAVKRTFFVGDDGQILPEGAPCGW